MKKEFEIGRQYEKGAIMYFLNNQWLNFLKIASIEINQILI